MSAKSINLQAKDLYTGDIPEGAIRMALINGEQVSGGQVVIGSGDPEPFNYGRNEYVVPEGVTSYTAQCDQAVEVVEDFVFMPASMEDYITAKFTELAAPMQAQIADLTNRVTALEAAVASQGGNGQQVAQPA